jgi:hypothetical protein
LVSETCSPEKSLTIWRDDEDEVPPRFDDENNTNNNKEGDKLGAFRAPSLEDIMRRLEKLTTENKKLRAKAKGKKIKGSSSST